MFIENTEELAQNKLLLLYIIKLSPNNFTKNEITEFVLDKNYMNYFLIQQYLSELINANFIQIIKEDSREVYQILEKGINALSYFEDRITDDIKNELNAKFNKDVEEKVIQTQVVCDYYSKENNQYVVNLKLVENEETLFSLYLDVGNDKHAKLICDNWKESPDHIYQNIIKVLVESDTSTLK